MRVVQHGNRFGWPCYTAQELKQCPSLDDGMSMEEVEKCRQDYCSLISDVGQSMRIPPWAVGTAIYYCHRFYAVRSMKSNDRFTLAIAALYLACKVEEVSGSGVKVDGSDLHPDQDRGKLENIVKAFWTMHGRESGFEEGHDPAKTEPADAETLKQVKAHALVAERALLFALQFQAVSCACHSTMLTMMQDIGWIDDSELAQTAWNFLNDSFRTTVTLQGTPSDVACAVLLLAATCARKDPATVMVCNSSGTLLWEAEDVDADVMRGIYEQVRQMYDYSEATPA